MFIVCCMLYIYVFQNAATQPTEGCVSCYNATTAVRRKLWPQKLQRAVVTTCARSTKFCENFLTLPMLIQCAVCTLYTYSILIYLYANRASFGSIVCLLFALLICTMHIVHRTMSHNVHCIMYCNMQIPTYTLNHCMQRTLYVKRLPMLRQHT